MTQHPPKSRMPEKGESGPCTRPCLSPFDPDLFFPEAGSPQTARPAGHRQPHALCQCQDKKTARDAEGLFPRDVVTREQTLVVCLGFLSDRDLMFTGGSGTP